MYHINICQIIHRKLVAKVKQMEISNHGGQLTINTNVLIAGTSSSFLEYYSFSSSGLHSEASLALFIFVCFLTAT